ncbi:MAG: helix-turn-helix transcriptional regulator [Clostridium sp.]|uniref:helix-turn-helix domain-containing protein n=1 Tax=Clostridium sp. TaxID=1506 RepID=UPI00290FFDA3|nr:helix-turn-helix transcriptional regulator [Clostridium sp.]MDU7336800.1 helix-turn-helix transcriptional regulator [Clostridium sp.]
MVDYLDIGKRIRKTRTAKGITQEKLAELICTGTTHVSHIETGNTIPSLKTFIAIVNALEVSPDELLCGNIDQSTHVFQNEITLITNDCSPKEIRVIAETISSLKSSMRNTFGNS